MKDEIMKYEVKHWRKPLVEEFFEAKFFKNGVGNALMSPKEN